MLAKLTCFVDVPSDWQGNSTPGSPRRWNPDRYGKGDAYVLR